MKKQNKSKGVKSKNNKSFFYTKEQAMDHKLKNGESWGFFLSTGKYLVVKKSI